jgi:hypothetical protein
MNSARQDAHAGGHSAVHGATGGLAVSTAGYTLQVSPKTFEAGQEEAFGLRILDRGGHAVRDFDEQHGERMHLIVVRRDLAHYLHLHPSLGTDGTWSVPLVLPEPGVYRAFADFSVGGESLTLGADLHVPGEMEVVSLPDPTSLAGADGYEVELDAGSLTAGAASSLTFRIAQEGQDVTELEPYLGALGHLVALREGDLAFLHVHPTGGAGARIIFHAVFPSMGLYKLFLQFAHEGRVHTVDFTTEILP